MIRNTVLLVLFIVVSVVIAGIFGIYHDQITYSISIEYFTHFKFQQFRIDPYMAEHSPRYCVAIVGFFATWWTGLIIGIVIGLIGIKKGYYFKFFKHKMVSLFYIFLITFTFSIIGYLIGILRTSWIDNDSPLNIGGNLSIHYDIVKVKNFVSFYKVGMIHNFSYIGGIVGLIIGVVFNLKKSKSIIQN